MATGCHTPLILASLWIGKTGPQKRQVGGTGRVLCIIFQSYVKSLCSWRESEPKTLQIIFPISSEMQFSHV